MHYTSLLLFLLFSATVLTGTRAQDDAPNRFRATFVKSYGFCSTDQGSPICANQGIPLKCKTLVDRTNRRELVALTHGNGVGFFQVSNSGNATLIARYPSSCPTLNVVGEWGNSVIVSSAQPLDAGQCRPLGLGLINFNQLDSTGNSQTTVNVTSDTTLFSTAQYILWSRRSRTLVVFGARNGTESPRDLILRATPGATPNFRTLFSGTFPFKLDPRYSVLFSEGDDTDDNLDDNLEDDTIRALWIVGPVRSANATSTNTSSNRVAIWSILSDTSNGAVQTEPQLISTIVVRGAKFVAVSEDDDVLFISQLAGDGQAANSSDELVLFDIGSLDSPALVANVTYQDMKRGGPPAGSDNVLKITALASEDEDVWVGWDTGEVFVLEVDNPLGLRLSFELEGSGNVFALAGNNTSDGGRRDVNNICPARLENESDEAQDRAYLTAYGENRQRANIFMGIQLEQDDTSGGGGGEDDDDQTDDR